MRQLISFVIVVAFIVTIAVTLHRRAIEREKARVARKLVMMIDNLNALSPDQEDTLTFYLTKQLGTYEGSFEIIEVVNLQTRDISGTEYLLVTLRAPNGKFCQVILSRKSLPWAHWQIESGSLKIVDIPQAEYITTTEKDLVWMKELGVTAEEVSRYLAVHPEKALGDAETLFVDQTTGKLTLPRDWWKSVKVGESPFRYKLEIAKNKTMRFVSDMKMESSDLFWKIDCPADYLGSGYRGYLFEKSKGQ